MEGKNSIPHASERTQQDKLPVRYDYGRPQFLELNADVEKEAKDHGLRNVLVPNNPSRMPWQAGYSEVINSGKTLYQNEDQASILVSKLLYENPEKKVITIPYVMFSIFDGHAGTGAALFAANQLHIHVREKFEAIKQFLAQEKAEVIAEDDVNKVPMISGHGKRARLLATIGTTRGLGDHDLEAPGSLYVKPFLTPVPQIKVFDLSAHKEFAPDDILILASDGLWERLTNEEAQECVKEALKKFDRSDPCFYINLARELVLSARGSLTQKGWRTQKDQIASGDDITCFVIPLMHFSKPPSSGCLGEMITDALDTTAQGVTGVTSNVLYH